MLKTNRGFWKVFFLTLITFGIYSWYMIHKMSQEANLVDPNGKKVGGLVAFILLSLITFGIYALYWNYKVCNKFAANVRTGGTEPKFDGSKYLLWALLGSLIIVGPIVAFVKELHLWNDSNKVYNAQNFPEGQPAA